MKALMLLGRHGSRMDQRLTRLTKGLQGLPRASRSWPDGLDGARIVVLTVKPVLIVGHTASLGEGRGGQPAPSTVRSFRYSH